QTVTFNAGGLRADETFTFNGGAETNGHFRIFGGGGNDVIHGGALDDVIFGGGLGDTLYGGGGNDTFRYQNVTESDLNEQDGIQDFNLGDKLDLIHIDADTSQTGDQAFTFIGSASFTSHAGELRAFDTGGGIWEVQGDVNGDGVADFQVAVVVTDHLTHQLTTADFLL
ncbi:MAG: M10 family metallopeptidase C-terminal domain-containing protein, partial [Allosphingosinicella sp.]